MPNFIGEILADYTGTVPFVEVSTEGLMKLGETGTPMNIGRLLVEPLEEIETIDGNTFTTPKYYRGPGIFRSGKIDVFGCFYEDDQEKFVQRIVASLPSRAKRWLMDTVSTGPEKPHLCKAKLIHALDGEDLYTMSQWHESDIKFLKMVGISDPTTE